MKIPEDWDRPDIHNIELCKLFRSCAYKLGDYRLNYRLFMPEHEKQEKIPLVIYLHGADAVGDDNELHLSMHDIGTMFAKKEWQEKNPCYIFAPQYKSGEYWSDSRVKNAVLSLIKKLSEKEDIDKNRIYIYGYSAGGVGTLRLVKENPGLFAGAISICGATNAENITELLKTPLWLIHAEDDEIVKISYKGGSTPWANHYGSSDIYEKLGGALGEILLTKYGKGEMKEKYGVNPHCSWVAVSSDEGSRFRDWLFSQRLDL
ncbi:MAG: prolyl oligopeptidase family serine peptidase [Lachnospiraceae bacterium]|nr:prolyl oligopeptidase family serine peptidase [Lachnospiraceae bacterium]